MKVTSKAFWWKTLQDRRKDRVGKIIEENMIQVRKALLGLITAAPPPHTKKKTKKKTAMAAPSPSTSASHCQVNGCKLPVLWNLVCHKHHVQVWNVTPRKSGIKGAGKGLFACAPFYFGDAIDIYAGEALCGRRWDGDYMLQLPESCWSVDGEHRHLGGMARFINASTDPSQINCEFKRVPNKNGQIEVPFFVMVITTRAIKSGEEFFVDYGPQFVFDEEKEEEEEDSHYGSATKRERVK